METIDEAALQYTIERSQLSNSNQWSTGDVGAAFKAGALWMAKQHANEISECTEKSFNDYSSVGCDK